MTHACFNHVTFRTLYLQQPMLAIDSDYVCNDRCAMLHATGWHLANQH